MAEVTSIAPLLHEPGLIAYECPSCGYLTSIVQPPADPPTWLTSAVNLKFLSLLAASSFRNFKFKTALES